jgi:hypothetical protein
MKVVISVEVVRLAVLRETTKITPLPELFKLVGIETGKTRVR